MTKKKAGVWLAAGGLVAALVLFQRLGFRMETPPTSVTSPARQPEVPPLDLQSLTARLNADPMPVTPEQIAEQRRMVEERIAYALHLLDSRDAVERQTGVEQLTAYLTPETEQRLARVLSADASVSVRVAAARSLEFAKAPGSASIAALLEALRQKATEVRSAALFTVTTYLNRLDRESVEFRQMVKGMKDLSKSKNLDKNTRQVLRQLLAALPG